MDLIDVVIQLALAGVAVAFGGMLLLRGRHGSSVAVRGRTIHHQAIWASALLLVGAVLVLRVGIEVVPGDRQVAFLAATVAAAAACLAVSAVAIARSRRP